MLIFQKNFNGPDYEQYLPDALKNKNQSSSTEAGSSSIAAAYERVKKHMDEKSAKNGSTTTKSAEIDVTDNTPQMGNPNYNWRENGVMGENSLLNRASREAAETASGKNDTAVDKANKVTNPGGKLPSEKTPHALVQSVVNKQQDPHFDETSYRANMKASNPTLSDDQLNDMVAEAKFAHDREVLAKHDANLTVEGINVDKVEAPKVETSPITTVSTEPTVNPNEAGNSSANSTSSAEKISFKDKIGDVKDKAVQKYGELSSKYGEGFSGSLAKDAAIAAGGLALAGGAYHLIKKRAAKKRAEKEALEARIKK